MEIWKDIEGYEGLYKVSNLGKIKSLARKVTSRWGTEYFKPEKMLKTPINKDGYCVVDLTKDKKSKSYRVNRLVALAFVRNSNIELNTVVNHKNEIKTDNRAENLEWCSQDYNINYGTRTERAINNSNWEKARFKCSKPLVYIKDKKINIYISSTIAEKRTGIGRNIVRKEATSYNKRSKYGIWYELKLYSLSSKCLMRKK